MFALIHEITDVPDYSMIGLVYGLLGFMVLVIGIGWISKIITSDRVPPRKQIPQESHNGSVNRKRSLPSKSKSR